MHIHAQMDDIVASSWAIPLKDIAELYAYREEFARAIGKQHYAGIGDIIRSREELEREMGKLVSMPIQIIGNDAQAPNSFRPKQFVLK